MSLITFDSIWTHQCRQCEETFGFITCQFRCQFAKLQNTPSLSIHHPEYLNLLYSISRITQPKYIMHISCSPNYVSLCSLTNFWYKKCCVCLHWANTHWWMSVMLQNRKCKAKCLLLDIKIETNQRRNNRDESHWHRKRNTFTIKLLNNQEFDQW